jgi:hypothetical protein
MAKIHKVPTGEPLLVDVTEACRQLGIGRTKLYGILPDLKSIVIGRKRLIFLSSIRDYAAELAEEQKASR